ncbi:MAG: hypothetical protein AAF899_00260 [Pseudomonadota bacterium]
MVDLLSDILNGLATVPERRFWHFAALGAVLVATGLFGRRVGGWLL